MQAAALPVAGGTAWDVLEKLGVAEGETLLINGVGGGVGVMAAQLARNRGAAVFGVGSETKRPMVESLAATLVPYDSGDVVEQMRELCLAELTPSSTWSAANRCATSRF